MVEQTRPDKKKSIERTSLIALLAVGIILLILLLGSLINGNNQKMVKQQSYSSLINTKEIAALSVSEFVYNGIAQSLKDNGEPDYNVLYKSTVKVSVDANGIKYSVDETQKTVTFIFPPFIIERPVIDVGSISLIPNRSNLYIDNVIALCRSDALAEAQKSEKLISSAQDNIRSIIEAWYSPVLKGYAFEYQFDIEEGSDNK